MSFRSSSAVSASEDLAAFFSMAGTLGGRCGDINFDDEGADGFGFPSWGVGGDEAMFVSGAASFLTIETTGSITATFLD